MEYLAKFLDVVLDNFSAEIHGEIAKEISEAIHVRFSKNKMFMKYLWQH